MLVCLRHAFWARREIAFCFHHVRPSVYLSVYTSAAVTGRISVKIDTRHFHETCREQPNLIKIEQNTGSFK